jgi:hypothetical protein
MTDTKRPWIAAGNFWEMLIPSFQEVTELTDQERMAAVSRYIEGKYGRASFLGMAEYIQFRYGPSLATGVGMSYAFKIKVENGTPEIVIDDTGNFGSIPDGTYEISGHHQAGNDSTSLLVTQLDRWGRFLISAVHHHQRWHMGPVPADAPPPEPPASDQNPAVVGDTEAASAPPEKTPPV